VIIDLHMHLDDSELVGLDVSPRDCVAGMDRAGVDAAVVMTLVDFPGPNPAALDLVADACGASRERLYGFARLDPGPAEAPDLLRRAVTELGFRGLKLHPVSTRAHPADDATVALVRVAGELGVPTLFHCGDDPLTAPLVLADTAAACPDATIVLGHMGGYAHVAEAIDVAEQHPNVVLETSAMPYPHKIREAVDRIGAHRVVFGSDGPMARPEVERDKVECAGLTAEQTGLVLGGNAARLLGVAA
jgi:hypothetical protein